jgi:hypothetical protein
MLLIAELPKDRAYGAASSSPLAFSQPEKLKLLKVNMGARSMWSDGGYYVDEMVNGARSSGYDAVLFADNALQFGTPGKLADPSFEDVNSTGYLTRWFTNVTGPMNSMSYAGPSTLPSPQANLIQSGTHGLHLVISSSSTNYSTTAAGYAFVRDVFPEGYSFNQTSTDPSHPLLLNDITFSAQVWINSLGYVGAGLTSADKYWYSDNGWFYLKFYFVTDAPGPRAGMKLTATIIYSDHRVDDWLRSIRSFWNSTQSGREVIYQDIPPLHQWLNLNVNVTDLARTLFNETIVENWRLGNFEIGTRSYNSALVDVYVDHVSINSKSSNPFEFFKSSIQRLSTSNLAVYAGYSLTVNSTTGQPSLYAYGTSLGPPLIQNINLADPTFWKNMTKEISSEGGIVVLGPVYSDAWRDYLVAMQDFDVPIIDGTTFLGLDSAGSALDGGEPVVFTATRETTSPTAYNSTHAWSVRVLAENNSEAAILDAIARGRAFLAIPNYTGNFPTSAYGFPMGRNPIYVPSGENASLTISFSSLGPGRVRVYQGAREVLVLRHTGTERIVTSLPMGQGLASTFFVAVTSTNDSLAIVGDPLKFAQASMIPGGALFIDNDAWSVQSTQWTASDPEQRMQLVVNGPAGTTATVYLFSPDFRPDAKSELKVARFITVNNATMDPASVYDAANSTFRILLRSAGAPIVIVLNFDVPQLTYLYEIFQSVVGLYILAVFPLAVVSVYSAMVRTRKSRRTKRESRR